MSKLVDCAVSAAKKAETVLSHYFLNNHQATRQGLEFKAAADTAADQVIFQTIKQSFPHHSILTEERVRAKQFTNSTWVVDPLDGTTNFICGFPLWAIAISLVHQGKILLGVISIPQLDRLYLAQAGKGTTLNGKKVRVSPVSSLKPSAISLDHDYHPKRRQVLIDIIHRLGENVSNLTLINSVCTSFALLASGNLQALIHPRVQPWELAAGIIMVKEAGGRITDLKGQPISFTLEKPTSSSVVASNGKIHRQLLALLK